MITSENLSVSFGKRTILDGISFEARSGALTAIVGPNGSGKTTLLRALSSDIPFIGKITINGRDLRRMKAWETAAIRAVLPQSTSLSFPFTVHEIVQLGLTSGRSGVRNHDVADLPDQALALVDLHGFAGRFYQELSGGEQQRVQLARVLCQVWTPTLDGQPRYLFLDEPISSLDVRHQLIIMQIARDFADRGGGVVAVLHDLNLTSMFADNVLVMRDGLLDAFGPPGSVFTNERLLRVYDCPLRVGALPQTDKPFILPQSAAL